MLLGRKFRATRGNVRMVTKIIQALLYRLKLFSIFYKLVLHTSLFRIRLYKLLFYLCQDIKGASPVINWKI